MPWLHNLCRSALAVAVLTTALRGHLCRWNCINRNHSITANLWCKHGFFWVHKPLLPVLIYLRFLSVHAFCSKHPGDWMVHVASNFCCGSDQD